MTSFPPGPRWFMGILVRPGHVSIRVVEGTNTSRPETLDLGTPDAVYVFGVKVTEEELLPLIRMMFEETGPSLIESCADKIEGIWMGIPLPATPGEC